MLAFAWSAALGALGVQTDTDGRSEVTWTAPVDGEGAPWTITVAITDLEGLVTEFEFEVQWDGSGSDLCAGRECGPDGLGGSCGECPEGEGCNEPEGVCVGPGEWVTIRAGTFVMGSPVGELGRFGGEDQHEVTLTHDFEIYSTEVTQDEFQALMGYNPSYWVACGGNCPVEMGVWHEAAAYCNALSDEEGLAHCYDCVGADTTVTCSLDAAYATPYDCPGYRLPTEAEWEYTARAETTTATYKSIWAMHIRAANRRGYTHDEHYNDVGFRPVRTLP